MQKKYIVRLTDEARVELQEVVKKLKGSSQQVRRAQVLLKADANGPNWTDERISETFSCRVQTVEQIRQRLVERGFRETIDGANARIHRPQNCSLENRKPRSLRCDWVRLRKGMPTGRCGCWRVKSWSTRLSIPSAMKPSGVRSKKRDDQPQDRILDDSSGVRRRVRRQHGGSARYLHHALRSRLSGCVLDEQPIQLFKETRTPIPATAKHVKRVDYEYERAGTANIFMFTEPLADWREVVARVTKTKVDWAVEMARILEGGMPTAKR